MVVSFVFEDQQDVGHSFADRNEHQLQLSPETVKSIACM
jgi:hypothetical protein